jgi:hypothetical protein
MNASTAQTATAAVTVVVAMLAVIGWRHHQWAHQMPAPLPPTTWDDPTEDAEPVTTWQWTLSIYPYGAPTQALPHAQGYLRAADRDTATSLAHHDADTLMPTNGYQGHLQITEIITPDTTARHHQPTEQNTTPPDDHRTIPARRPTNPTPSTQRTIGQPPANIAAAQPTTRWPRGPRPTLPIVAAMATALLGLGPNLTAPILAADTATTRPASTPQATPASAGPSCGPAAIPAGHNPPRRVGLAVGDRGIVPAGWIRWCTGAPGNFRVGTVWLVIGLDRTIALASDACQLRRCQITIALDVPTQSPYGHLFHAQIDTTGPPQATITTTSLTLGHHDFAEAYSTNPWMYITHGYTESV